MSIFQEFEFIPINCLWIDPDKLIEIIKLMREQDETRFWVYSKQCLNLKEIFFPAPPSGGAHLPKFAVWQPSNMSFGSVLIPNREDGMTQLMRHLNRRHQIRYFSARLSRDYKEAGICQFEHADEAGAQRVVHVIRDRGWEFYDQGKALSFENMLNYQQRKTVERLTPEIVIGYLKTLGWNLDDEGFWKSNSHAWVARKTQFK